MCYWRIGYHIMTSARFLYSSLVFIVRGSYFCQSASIVLYVCILLGSSDSLPLHHREHQSSLDVPLLPVIGNRVIGALPLNIGLLLFS